MKAPIDLHLVSWNRYDMTELVIRTIHRNTKPENFRLVVLDNGSDDETLDKLHNLYDAGLIDEFIPIKTNLGLEAARNLMLNQATQSDYFICVDNDCLPPPLRMTANGFVDWIEDLYDLLQKYEDFAAIAARTQVMIGTGEIFGEAEKAGEDILEFPHPGGSLRIMNTGVTYLVGGWARNEPGRGAEERYICGKLNDAGFRTAFAVNIRCLHLFGTRDDKPTDRWGYDKDLKPEETGHSDISHPALDQGDSKEEVLKFASEEDTERYFHVNSGN